MTETRRAFFSYSHDSEEHKTWVLGLATYLRENGIDVILDQWDVDLGDDLAAFMEQGIRDIDRVIVVCTDNYIRKANLGEGGVGYEKTIATAQILGNTNTQRKFIPVVRNVLGPERLPTFLGARLYLDLSEDEDDPSRRATLLRNVHQIQISKPGLGTSPFIPELEQPIAPPVENQPELEAREYSSREVANLFTDRFVQSFPGVRGIEWINDEEVAADRISRMMAEPLTLGGTHFAWWWRGPANLQIEKFERIEGSSFLMGPDELTIKKIAAVNPNIPGREFIYVETYADEPTGLYEVTEEDIERSVRMFGHAEEEYGLVDGTLPVTRPELDDGAAIIDGEPKDIRGRCKLRARHITPYNFLIAPNQSPINNDDFDTELENYLNQILAGTDVFNDMTSAIKRLPKRRLPF
jgi:TIR domain